VETHHAYFLQLSNTIDNHESLLICLCHLNLVYSFVKCLDCRCSHELALWWGFESCRLNPAKSAEKTQSAAAVCKYPWFVWIHSCHGMTFLLCFVAGPSSMLPLCLQQEDNSAEMIVSVFEGFWDKNKRFKKWSDVALIYDARLCFAYRRTASQSTHLHSQIKAEKFRSRSTHLEYLSSSLYPVVFAQEYLSLLGKVHSISLAIML